MVSKEKGLQQRPVDVRFYKDPLGMKYIKIEARCGYESS